MLTSILKDQYGKNRGQDLRKIYQSHVICGCLFQSFDDFQKNIILRFIANEGKLSDKQLQKQLNPNDPNVSNQLKEIFFKLQELAIIEYLKLESCYKILKNFSLNLQKYILNPVKLAGSQLPTGYKNEMEQFDLLRLLYEGNPILYQCKLTTINWRSLEDNLTKQNFDYIRAPISQKIGILIKGYLRYTKNKANLNDILILSLLDPNRAYKISDKNFTVVKQLQSLKLLKKINQNQFVISQYLHHFAFASKRSMMGAKRGSLKCKIIIQTNFKVYAQLKSSNKQNYQMLKSILKSLIRIEHQQYNFEQLIVGQITQDKVLALFKRGITSNQYFDFFQQYMEKSSKIQQKDLGKWNKIKFLGLQGINSESSIPNNVKQQIKLWENMQKYRQMYGGFGFDGDDIAGSDDDQKIQTNVGATRRR